MITALATQYPDRIKLEITYPESKKPIYKYVINKREASIVVYALYRNYIFNKLNRWLKQRIYWLERYDPLQAKKANELRTLLGVYELATLRNICRFGANNRAAFESLAPKSTGRQHHYFINRITVILNFCNEIGGQE